MWWEYVVVAGVVIGAVAVLVGRLRRTLRGKADCDCGCEGACPGLDAICQALAADAPDEPTDMRDGQSHRPPAQSD